MFDGVEILVCEMSENIDFKNDFKFNNITYYYSFEYFEEYLIAFNN